MVPPFETVSAPILQMKKLKLRKVKVHDQWKLAKRSSHVIGGLWCQWKPGAWRFEIIGNLKTVTATNQPIRDPSKQQVTQIACPASPSDPSVTPTPASFQQRKNLNLDWQGGKRKSSQKGKEAFGKFKAQINSIQQIGQPLAIRFPGSPCPAPASSPSPVRENNTSPSQGW